MSEDSELFAKLMPVDRGTRVAVCINLLCSDTGGGKRPVGSGSGFFRRYQERYWLITNWHVLTGRHPDSPQTLLEGFPDSPTHFELVLPQRDDPNHFVPSAPFPLYDQGKPLWTEGTALGSRADLIVDLATVPFEFSDSDMPLFECVDDFLDESLMLRVGRDVLIVGYPFGIRAENPHAIWKRGFVASEPAILIGGQPKFLIDSPGRPGMSGSPVFMIKAGLGVSAETKRLLLGNALDAISGLDADELANAPEVNILRFAGVYSGSIGDAKLERLRVGVAWHAFAVDRLSSQPSPGQNPCPPIHAD